MRRLRRFLLLCLVAAVIAALGIAVAGLAAKAANADVAIVFGNTVDRQGRPSARLRARLDEAKRLYSRGRVRRIIVSGGVGAEGVDESTAMKRYLISSGVPEARIHADRAGLNSALTAANARTYMDSTGLKSADIVTQYFHIPRAMLACRAAGIEVVGASAPRYFELRDLYSLARETVALPVYAIRRR